MPKNANAKGGESTSWKLLFQFKATQQGTEEPVKAPLGFQKEIMRHSLDNNLLQSFKCIPIYSRQHSHPQNTTVKCLHLLLVPFFCFGLLHMLCCCSQVGLFKFIIILHFVSQKVKKHCQKTILKVSRKSVKFDEVLTSKYSGFQRAHIFTRVVLTPEFDFWAPLKNMV